MGSQKDGRGGSSDREGSGEEVARASGERENPTEKGGGEDIMVVLMEMGLICGLHLSIYRYIYG